MNIGARQLPSRGRPGPPPAACTNATHRFASPPVSAAYPRMADAAASHQPDPSPHNATARSARRSARSFPPSGRDQHRIGDCTASTMPSNRSLPIASASFSACSVQESASSIRPVNMA